MLYKLKNFEWLLLLKWVIVNSVSIVIGFIVVIYISILVTSFFPGTITESALAFTGTFLMGLINGSGQTVLLRLILPNRLPWIIATGAGWAGFPFLIGLLYNISYLYILISPFGLFAIILIGAIMGIMVGTLQLLVLRKFISFLRPWLLTNMLAFPLALFSFVLLAESIPFSLSRTSGDPFYLIYTIIGTPLAIWSLTTGLGFLWLKRQHHLEQSSPTL